jgi:hypothetical protein
MQESATEDGPYEWSVVATPTFAFGLVGLDRLGLAPLFPAKMKS